jgi:hypothetical protein
MASLTIIPYVSVLVKAHKGLQIKPSILLADTPQPQTTAVADNSSDLAMHEKDSDTIDDDDDRLEGRGSHVSACAD